VQRSLLPLPEPGRGHCLARRALRCTSLCCTIVAFSSSTRAQELDPQPGSVVVQSGTGQVVVAPGQTTTQQVYVPPPGYPAPGTDVNAGLPSSSRPTTNTASASDTFDLSGGDRGTGSVVIGKAGSTAILSSESRPVRSVPAIHTVRRGDTLWDLCGKYYDNPYDWPKVWSYNPQIQNPHWIYPGDQLRMRVGGDQGLSNVAALGGGRGGGPGAGRGGAPGGEGGQSGFVDRRSAIPEDTVFLRDQGFIGDSKRDVWGELVGAREDQMLLADGNHIYMVMRPGVDVKVGQELTLFTPARQPKKVAGARKPPGEIVRVKGTVRIDQWDPKTRVARGRITESVDVIERGARVGPVGRRFDVVPPRTNETNMWARVLGSAYPHVYYAQNQVVFIDRGSTDGMRPGNRLFVVRRGDAWRDGVRTATKMARERIDMDSPAHVDIERTPLRGEETKFPEEIIGELRILRSEKYSSVALVTISHREIVAGDRAVARKGY
jgi:hypothetical protein